MRFAKLLIVASATILISSSLLADPATKPTTGGAGKPDVATLLFGNPQWGHAPAGSTLDYTYSKKTTQASFGPSFDDHILLKLDKGDTADARTAQVKMFSGINAKPAGPFQSDQQNPVLLLVLEENVQELSKLFKANPRYLKNAIRKAWRNDVQITSVQIDVDGKSVPGTKITVAPFTNDAEKEKMMGLEGMTYTVEIADSVPGNIATIDIHAPADGKPSFSEVLRFKGEKQ